MNTTQLVVLLLIINLIISLVVLVVNLATKRGVISFIYFVILLLFPIFGCVFFLGSSLVYRLSRKGKSVAYEDISFDTTRVQKKQKADLEEELNILSLEESFLVSGKQDRRHTFLSTLKGDYSKTLHAIKQGLDNDDSETSHYAATAVMATMSEYLNQISEKKKTYEASKPEDGTKAIQEYLDVLRSFFESKVMDDAEKMKYVKMYDDLLAERYNHYDEKVLLDDYVMIMDLLIEQQDYERGLIWSDRAFGDYAQEDVVYNRGLKLRFENGDSEEFFKLLNELKRSNVAISGDTLQIIRFFSYQ